MQRNLQLAQVSDIGASKKASRRHKKPRSRGAEIIPYSSGYAGEAGIAQVQGHSTRIGEHSSKVPRAVFSDTTKFRVSFKHLNAAKQVPESSRGSMVAFRATKPLSPITALTAICDGIRLTGFYFGEFFSEMGVDFSPHQVEDTLSNESKWGLLNTDGLSNVFVVKIGKSYYTIIARRVAKKWYLSDSILGIGRGYDPGARFLFRNKPDPKMDVGADQ